MAEKENTVRKVFMLPLELVERIDNYRIEQGLGSEVEAVRRLLDGALLHRDTTNSILRKMIQRYKAERDLRIIARDLLATHPLVDSIKYRTDGVAFTVLDDFQGLLDLSGNVFISKDGIHWIQLHLNKDGVLSADEEDIPF